MKVKDLKRILEHLPDDAPVLVPSYDHSYREAHCVASTALMEGRNQWTEDYGEETTPEAEFGERVSALIVGA